MSKQQTKIYPDGFSIRLKNRRILCAESTKHKDAVYLEFQNTGNTSNEPTAICSVVRNKINITSINLSHEAMANLCIAYLKYIEHKTK